jgi:deazaflavin-dependent oxidoreductase (nitroreductase family)
MVEDRAGLAAEQFCYLTTTGRRSGQPHTIEIWFALDEEGATAYLLSGGRDRSDWVRNLRQDPSVRLRIGADEFAARARVVTDPAEDALARDLVAGKYQPAYAGDLSGWRRDSLPVAVDLDQRHG